MADVWTSIPDRTTSDNYSVTDFNAHSQGIRILGGNGSSQPTTSIEALYTQFVNAGIGSTYSVDGNYTITDFDGYSKILAFNTGASSTITLPTLVDNYNRLIRVVHAGQTGTNTVTVDGEGAETITMDGLTTVVLPSEGDYIEIIGSEDAGCWLIISERISAQLWLDTYAGYGSVDTKIMRFTNSRENIGNMFTENHSTGYNGNQEGLEITIVKSGKYSFSFSNQASAAASAFVGISKNSTQLTTAVQSITISDCLMLERASTSHSASCSVSLYLSAGDIIRAHADGIIPVTAGYSHFLAVYLGS